MARTCRAAQGTPLKLLGRRARAFVQDKSRRDRAREFYMLQPSDDGPRALTWEEARLEFLPLGATVRGVVEETRRGRLRLSIVDFQRF